MFGDPLLTHLFSGVTIHSACPNLIRMYTKVNNGRKQLRFIIIENIDPCNSIFLNFWIIYLFIYTAGCNSIFKWSFFSFLLQLKIQIQNENSALVFQLIYSALILFVKTTFPKEPQAIIALPCSCQYLIQEASLKNGEEWGFLLYYHHCRICYTWIDENLNAIK